MGSHDYWIKFYGYDLGQALRERHVNFIAECPDEDEGEHFDSTLVEDIHEYLNHLLANDPLPKGFSIDLYGNFVLGCEYVGAMLYLDGTYQSTSAGFPFSPVLTLGGQEAGWREAVATVRRILGDKAIPMSEDGTVAPLEQPKWHEKMCYG